MKVLQVYLFIHVIVVTRSITVPPASSQTDAFEQVRPHVLFVQHAPRGSDAAHHHPPHSYQAVRVDRGDEKTVEQRRASAVHRAASVHGHQTRNKDEEEEALSPHELPRDVPTKPLYPGIGQWAKYGVRHRPYVNQQDSASVEEADDENERPEGYEIFEQGKEQFDKAKLNFRHNADKYPSKYKISESEEGSSLEDVVSKPKIGFIPQKLYAQVRKTESEKHLPRSEIDPEEEDAARLREVIKDSKIHTVYTEEGYEDSAYDHAGHEKNAENSESNYQLDEHRVKSLDKNNKGRSEKQKGELNERRKANDRKLNRHEEEQEDEIDSASSEHQVKNIKPAPTKDTQKIQLNNGKNIDLEIHTEVKYVPESDKRHKYVKIVPKAGKTRTKRYDKELLSKRYIRKRPNYYWKKNKTTQKNDLNGDKPRNSGQVQSFIKTSTNVNSASSPNIASTTARAATSAFSPYILNKELETNSRNSTKTSLRPKSRSVSIKKMHLKRQKRFTVDHPDIPVDLDKYVQFEKIQTTTPKPDLTHIKYPYYKLASTLLNINSPLRYAENLSMIPKKRAGKMSFYESRAHIKCPEIETDINPIPERISNQHEDDAEDETEHDEEDMEMPRLNNLGDKIDCLKAKYFGEDPLDSPFFKENTINLPIPIVLTNYLLKNNIYEAGQNSMEYKKSIKRNTDKINNDQIQPNKNKTYSKLSVKNLRKNKFRTKKPVTDNDRITTNNSKKRELKIEILEPIVVVDDELFETLPTNNINKNMKTNSEPLFTITKIANENKEGIVKNSPKNIYDQLILLEKADEGVKNMDEIKPEPEKFLIIYENHHVGENENDSSENILNKPKSTTDNLTATTEIPTMDLTFKKSPEVTQSPKIKETKLRNNKTISKFSAAPDTTTRPEPLNIPSPPKIENTLTQNDFIRRQISPYTYIFDISKYLPKVPTQVFTASVSRNRRTINSNEKHSASFLQQDQNPSSEVIRKVIHKRSTHKYTFHSKHRLMKRHVNEQFLKDEDNDDLLMDGTKIFEQYVPYTLHDLKSRQNVNNLEKSSVEANEDDLIMSASGSIPTYVSVTRKPKVYTEIVRQRPANREHTEIDDEEEDLNPRKRIYELRTFGHTKSEKTIETVEDADEELFETTTTPPTTAVPIIYPVEANSDDSSIAQYIFIIEKLHEKRQKENPTTTETVDKPETNQPDTDTLPTQVTSESVNIQQGEPAYLQIVNHLHDVRHQIEQNKSLLHDEEPSSSNAQVQHQTPERNFNPFNLDSLTPDSFMAELSSMQSKLNPDNAKAEPDDITTTRTRNFNSKLKTSIDTSKYKSIDRGGAVNMRHNFSSRYNSADQELPLNKSLTTQKPILYETTTRMLFTESTGSQTTPTSTDEISRTLQAKPSSPTTSTRLRQRTRTRSRPTASTTTTTTTQPVEAVTINPAFRRRRPTRLTSTTTEPTTTTKLTTIAHRGRHTPRLYSHTRVVTTEPPPPQSSSNPVVTELPQDVTREPSTIPPENKKRRTLQKVHERRVMSEVTLTRYYEPVNDEADSLLRDSMEDAKSAEESKKHQYEVIGPLTHVDTRHGGNYKYAPNTTERAPKSKDNKISTLPNPETFYKDPHLATNINQLKEEPNIVSNESESTNSLYTKKHTAKKTTTDHSRVEDRTYPNMAQMVNRLATVDLDATTLLPEEYDELDDSVTTSPTYHKPKVIKDPSRRMYFYANV